MKSESCLINDILIYSYEFDIIDSMMYILRIDDKVIIVDPHKDKSILDILSKNDDISIFLTHEHFDHISGVNWFKENFNSIRVYSSNACSNKISLERNGTELFPLLLIGDKKAYKKLKLHYSFPYHCVVDQVFNDFHIIKVNNHIIKLLETPGHTDCSISILIDDLVLFAGDSLLGNGQEFRSVDSNILKYKNITLPLYKELINNDTMVFPGHGKPNNINYFLERQEL